MFLKKIDQFKRSSNHVFYASKLSNVFRLFAAYPFRSCRILSLDVSAKALSHSHDVETLRGLHYQSPPKAQGKLVRVIQGEVFDVVVDIRKASPTFGQWVGEILSADNKKQLWMPEGFAHGFLTLSDTAEFAYKTTNYYAPEIEQCIAWDDPTLGIHWPLEAALVKMSIKDEQGRPFL